jgi:hypothetical protein
MFACDIQRPFGSRIRPASSQWLRRINAVDRGNPDLGILTPPYDPQTTDKPDQPELPAAPVAVLLSRCYKAVSEKADLVW